MIRAPRSNPCLNVIKFYNIVKIERFPHKVLLVQLTLYTQVGITTKPMEEFDNLK